MKRDNNEKRNISILILVAALGYFVDIYDLLLFLIVKNKSLIDLGVSPADLTDTGLNLMSWQMAGLLLGGILWGVLGDKKGRLYVLFGSILMYSLANITNGMIQDISWYAPLRFIAGIGLAGELGAGITLISETMSKEKRGYGTMIVASVGLFGAVAAYFVGANFDWRIAYYVGGVMGLLLLLLRIGVFESGMFARIKTEKVRKGDFMMLFNHAGRFKKYLFSILIAVPVWFVVGILVGIANDFAIPLGIKGNIDSGKAVMFTYVGIAFGDFLTGTLSQVFKTRKKIVFVFLTLTYAGILFFLLSTGLSVEGFYVLCVYFGIATGYWVVFVTMASEQFGTNLRATVTTTVPNFVRGSLIPVTWLFKLFREEWGMVNAAIAVGTLTVAIAYWALWHLNETYGKELDYLEEAGETGL
jgi:putative MFS transporter